MNFLERIPTRWLLTAAALACLFLWAGPGWAQTTGDPVAGRALFDDTSNTSGIPFTGDCVGCHPPGVQNRRISIGGHPFADISFETAMTRFTSAIGRVGSMNQFGNLGEQRISDIAAYIADTPKVTSTDLTGTTLPFVATAVGNAVTKNITIRHSEATNANLTITGVTLSGGTSFTRTAACNGAVRAPLGTCTFSVTFIPASTAAENRTLTVSLQQESTSFTRVITLSGSVQGATPPPPPPSGGGDAGGGGLGLVWLAGLALAVAALARQHRRPA
jgi:mono/diheme cytochrome c family protein